MSDVGFQAVVNETGTEQQVDTVHFVSVSENGSLTWLSLVSCSHSMERESEQATEVDYRCERVAARLQQKKAMLTGCLQTKQWANSTGI
jgi:hypothetical protein